MGTMGRLTVFTNHLLTTRRLEGIHRQLATNGAAKLERHFVLWQRAGAHRHDQHRGQTAGERIY